MGNMKIAAHKKYTFVCKEHEEYGGLGWQPDWMPNADPLPGMGVAHDILEHTPNTDGSTEDEFKALGGAWWVRGETGWFYENNPHNVNTPEQHLSADFPDILNRVLRDERTFNVPRKTMPLDEETEEAFSKIITLGTQDHYDEQLDAGNDPDSFQVVFTDDDARERITGWMRIGYRETKARFAHSQCPNHEVAHMFKQIMEQANKYLEHAEEGCILRVSFDATNRVVKVENFTPWEAEEESLSLMPEL